MGALRFDREHGGASVNIEYLHYYLDVAKTKSITRAAKLNFISPQGMSRAMNELEKELGCRLLVRYSNKLDLSPVGEKLVERAADIVDRYSEMLEFAASQSQPQRTGGDCIHLECQNVAMLAFLPQEAKDYIFESPNIRFRESQNSQIRQFLLSNKAGDPATACSTIGLMCFFNQERSSGMGGGIGDLEERGYEYRPYLRSCDKVMVCASSPLAAKQALVDEDIMSRPLVCTNSHLYSFLSKRFGRDAIALSSAEFSLRKRLVERDSAISFLPAFASLTMPEEEGFVLRDMDRPYEVEIGFVGMEQDLKSECFTGLMRILDGFYRAHLDSGLYMLCD